MAERPDDLATIRGVRPVLDRSIKQIAKLVDDLLDVSRITRGMIVIEKQPVELAGIVQQALAPIQPLIASQHQELTLSLHELWVDADPLRLEQVITNLIHNAAKYSATGGHIWVSTTAKDGGIELRVRDDGIGIDPEILPRLFDMFVQVDTSLARTQGGLGIGLTIVRKLVELHGGTVRATSAGEGRGSEFIVWLPGRLEPRTAAPAPSPERSRSARRIVVVDDNEDAADTLAMLLRVRGHEVAIARDGPSAITTVAEQHPEIVLLDLGLPGMTGYDVARHLRASNASDLRIVAVSGYGQPEDIARAHAAGCDAHLAKPVDLDALARLLDAG
jgi:two-component system CheB/CheR fusion protein